MQNGDVPMLGGDVQARWPSGTPAPSRSGGMGGTETASQRRVQHEGHRFDACSGTEQVERRVLAGPLLPVGLRQCTKPLICQYHAECVVRSRSTHALQQAATFRFTAAKRSSAKPGERQVSPLAVSARQLAQLVHPAQTCHLDLGDAVDEPFARFAAWAVPIVRAICISDG
eukprot:4217672-Prymnesium_polylepis.1